MENNTALRRSNEQANILGVTPDDFQVSLVEHNTTYTAKGKEEKGKRE